MPDDTCPPPASAATGSTTEPLAPAPEPGSIQLGPSSRAFYAGAGAGALAARHTCALTTQVPGATTAEQSAYFWLTIGQQLQAQLPGATDEEQALFVRGAATRAPAPPAMAFSLQIESFDSAAFTATTNPGHGSSAELSAPGAPASGGSEEDPGPDEAVCRRLVSALLQRAAREIREGASSGDLHLPGPAVTAGSGLLVVGSFQIGGLP